MLIIGTLLGPVPYIQFVGGILALIGAILVILGRHAFGAKHARNAIWSIIIYIVSLGVLVIGFVILFASILSATITARNGNGVNFIILSQALTSAFNTFLVATIIAGAIGGIAYVLFTYAIQNENGRIILWAAYISSLAITIINSILVSQTLSDVIQRSINGNTFDPTPLQNLQAQFQAFQLLSLIPASLYATALYLVWSRIGRGELPAKPPTIPATPSPTMPPSNPPSPPPIQ